MLRHTGGDRFDMNGDGWMTLKDATKDQVIQRPYNGLTIAEVIQVVESSRTRKIQIDLRMIGGP